MVDAAPSAGAVKKQEFAVTGMDYVGPVVVGRKRSFRSTYAGQSEYTTEVVQVANLAGALLYTTRNTLGAEAQSFLSAEGLFTLASAGRTWKSTFPEPRRALLFPPCPGLTWRGQWRTDDSSDRSVRNLVAAEKIENIGETVIYKLLYFMDFDFYEKYEEQLIGATYQKNKYGPTPIEFAKIVEQMTAHEEIMKVKSEYFNYPQTKYLPLRTPDLTKLTATEVEVIDDVLNRLSDMNASQISAYSHGDVPWVTTNDGDAIEYESVFYRTPPYSVRAYAEEN